MPDVFVSPEEKPQEVIPAEKERLKIQGHTHNRLSAFSLYPDDVDFETREKNEEIILMLRKHPVTNFKWVTITILVLLGPSLAGVFGIFKTLPIGYGLTISLIWYLVTSAYALENFLDWYFDVYFVTNMRIVNVEFSNLINKHVSGAIVDKVQDVSYTTTGIFRTIFDYGDVSIQTAAEVPEFKFLAVPSPERVAKVIDDLKIKTKPRGGSI